MYNTSQNYKDKILKDSTQHELNIYIDEKQVEPNHIGDFKTTLELFNNNEICLGSTPEIDIEFEIDKRDLPDNYNEVYIESGLEDEIIPVGKFTIQSVEDDEFKVKIKATDYMKKFEDNKYDGSDLTYPATMLQVLQDICTKIGAELGSTSFLNSDKQISGYDNTVSARTYLSYIAEQAGGFAVIGRDGKLYIRTFGQYTVNVDINLFKDYKWGDKFKISKVSYEDGVQDYKFGDNTADTIYINQNNMYIVDRNQIEKIYNQIKNFEVYSFEGETIIDPAYDIGDILIIDGKKVLFQGELEYAGKFKANIKSKIQAKTEQESMQTKNNNSQKIKRIESKMNQTEGKITQLAQETSENTEKIAKHEISIEGITEEVKKKVGEEEFSTKLQTDWESVQVAWNKISDFIKMMVFNNNASLCIVDSSNNVIASFDKDGEHFFKSGEKTPFGEMGVQTIEEQNYISFAVEGEYGQQNNDGMAWGIKTKSDGKFYPILYIKNFEMADKNTDGGSGELVLASCNLVLDGLGTGIQSGGVKIEGDPSGSGLYFYDANDATQSYIQIFPKNILDEATVRILDKIQFYKNQAGTHSFLIGDQDGNHCLFTSDGSIYGNEIGLGGNVYIDSNGDVTGDLTFYSLPSYQGDLFVYGEGHKYHLNWTGSQLQFWVDITNVGTLSDKRLKKEIQDIDEYFINAIEEIEMKQFKVANRNGLISFGIMAQDLIEIFKKYNKNPFDYEIVYETQYRKDDDTIYYAVNYEQFLILKQKATDVKIRKLEDELKLKDKLIKDLLSRVERLEEGGAK